MLGADPVKRSRESTGAANPKVTTACRGVGALGVERAALLLAPPQQRGRELDVKDRAMDGRRDTPVADDGPARHANYPAVDVAPAALAREKRQAARDVTRTA